MTAATSSPFDITARPITVTASTNSKTYNGTTSAAASPSITSGSLAAGDTADFTEAYTGKNAGTGLALVPTGTVNDGNSGANYDVTFVNASTGTITPAPIVIAATSDSKTYDGTVASSKAPSFQVTGLAPNTLYTGDNFTTLTEAFESKNALGSGGSTLSVSDVLDDGNSGHNYAITTQTATGTINPVALVITAVTDSKTYDGTTTSSLTPTYQVAGLAANTLETGDSLTSLGQAFASKNALGSGASTLAVSYVISDGNAGHNYAVTAQTATGTINPVALVINALSASKTYDGTTSSTATPTFQVTGLTANTLFDGDSFTSLSQAYEARTVLGSNGSTLAVSYVLNDGNRGADYSVTTHTATGTITPAPLTVQANNVSAVYGSALPALTYSITGFVGGDNSTMVAGAPVLSTTAAAGANAGAYPITVASGTLSATNYTFPAADLLGGTLTVTPAPLVITAVSTTMLAGHSVPALTATYSGFVNGNTPANLTTAPVLSTTATPSSAPGNYPITVGGASSPNYSITYAPATLTVTLPLANVENVSIQNIKLSRHKSVKGIVLQFNEALDAATAQKINSYSLATMPKNKRQKSKPVALSKATYDASTFTVTLFTKKALALNPPLSLTVKAASVLDSLGRELDGNDSGQPGGNFTAILSKAGVTVTSSRALARSGSLSSVAVDRALESGILSGR
jgi:hypothetical protein